MVFTDDLQTSFNETINEYGTWVNPYTFTGSIGSWGDATYTYTEQGSVAMMVQPIKSEEEIIATFGERIEGELIAYAKSGIDTTIGNRYIFNAGSYKNVKNKEEIVSGVLIYTSMIWNRESDN